MKKGNSSSLVHANVYQYNALAQRDKVVYTDDDELKVYGSRGILNPNSVSYYNLYINGVLQPKTNYHVQKGLLTLTTEDTPLKGSTIVLSFVTFSDKKVPCLYPDSMKCPMNQNQIPPPSKSEKAFVMVPKVLSQYKDRVCLRDFAVHIEPHEFSKISFKSGFIVDSTLQIDEIPTKPKYRRVRFTLRIPYEITTDDNATTGGYLTDINRDIIMYMPRDFDEFIPHIVVETNSKLLYEDVKAEGQLSLIIGVFIIIKSMENVIVQVPYFNVPWRYPLCIDFLDYICEKFKKGDCRPPDVLRAEHSLFNAYSEEDKRIFTNADQIPAYGSGSILGPEDVSYFNLYINGVLQPKTNYVLEESFLEIITMDTPLDGVPITLEFVKVKDKSGKVLRGETYLYNAYGHSHETYTDFDEIAVYGQDGILNPKDTSFQHLFVNGVLQPKVNYTVEKGILKLTTDDLPLVGSPISLQFVSLYK